ncbi:MAG: tryptophan 2,3-dioxygenase [Nitriliruptorales bacterium]|nr:tryptophan 2,3-dioxygenase [Nitriliruptorales bacterium]
MASPRKPLYYPEYLQLDRILDAQYPESAKDGSPAHDEMLFIIVHQTFELWFKQILHELDLVQGIFDNDTVPEKHVGRAVHALRRINEIQRLLIDQLGVLETMTPLDFLDFRDDLVPASGFQSMQFRQIENLLGLDPAHRLKIKGAAYVDVLSEEHARLVRATEHQTSLLDCVQRWLERTPFVSFGDFDFWDAYRAAVESMLARDRMVVETHPNIDAEERSVQLARFDDMAGSFDALFDRDQWEALRDTGKRRFSHRAILAALLINLYRDEPIFQLPFRFLTGLVDIDEGFTAWRQRHALMVHRMIGGRIGTGGTSGHGYLEAAADKHRTFQDLFDLPTFFIPRSALPELPMSVREQLDFRYHEPA